MALSRFALVASWWATALSYVTVNMSYTGIGSSTADPHTWQIAGFMPNGTGRFPVHIWVPATQSRFDDPPTMQMLQGMADRGFLSVSVNYANEAFCVDVCGQATCPTNSVLFGSQSAGISAKASSIVAAVTAVCNHVNANCSAGLAVAGFSQGGFITLLLTKLVPQISAVLVFGVGGSTTGLLVDCLKDQAVSPYLPKSKRRYVDGEFDTVSGRNGADLAVMSGYDCSTTSSSAPVNCIQADGSGYYVVAQQEYAQDDVQLLTCSDSHDCLACHSFFVNSNGVLYPSFSRGRMHWSLGPGQDWLAKAATGKTWTPPADLPTNTPSPRQNITNCPPSTSSSTCTTFGADRRLVGLLIGVWLSWASGVVVGLCS